MTIEPREPVLEPQLVADASPYDAVPAELRERPQWVVWKPELRDGKMTKVPFRADGSGRASSTDPATWSSFADAVGAVDLLEAAGIGFVFTEPDPFVGVDLDAGLDAAERAAIVAALDSYAETSVSGQGAHVIVRASLGGNGRRRSGPVEVYASGRYFVVTGDRIAGTPTAVEARQDELDDLLSRYLPAPEPAAVAVPTQPVDLDDRELLERAMRARNGAVFADLWQGSWEGRYASHSEADLALAGLLAFWVGRDAGRVDGLFRASGLMRAKWDERRGETTYGAQTIAEAIAGCRDVYDPQRTQRAEQVPPALLDPAGEIGADALLPFRALRAFIKDRPAMPELPLIGTPKRAFMPRGALVVLGGIGGAGKTTLATDGVAHWASGATWNGYPVEKPLRIGIIDIEGPREPMRQKLEHKLEVWPGASFAENVFVLDGPDWGRFSFADPDDRRRLRNSCLELALDVVVANPVGRLGMRGGGTPEEVGEFVGWLRECGCWTTTAYLLLHHLNRGLHRELLLRLSGAWDRDADTIILLAREGQRKTKITWAKLRWAQDGGPEDENEILEWDIPTLGFRRLVTPEKHSETLEEIRARVLAYLVEQADDWRATNAVLKSVDGTDKTKREALFDLFEDGEIALSVGGPGKPVQPVGEAAAADYRRPRLSRYWKALNHAPSQSAIPLPPTPADTTLATPKEDSVGESAATRRGADTPPTHCTGFDSETITEPEETS